jgi:hypothetical protein
MPAFGGQRTEVTLLGTSSGRTLILFHHTEIHDISCFTSWPKTFDLPT